MQAPYGWVEVPVDHGVAQGRFETAALREPVLDSTNLRVAHIGDRSWRHWWSDYGSRLPPGLRVDIKREVARLALVVMQIKTIETQQREAVQDGAQPAIALLARLSGIGVGSSWLLIKDCWAGGAFITGEKSRVVWDWHRRPTAVAKARSSKASARPATSDLADD